MTISSESHLLRSGKVAVLYGGVSSEREVSLKSGEAVLAALLRSGVDAEGVDTARPDWINGFAERYAGAFIALHGSGGEDGTVQGALELAGVAYTGSGVTASGLAMDKLRTKWLWRGVGLPTPDFAVLSAESDWSEIIRQWGSVIVKPANEGSSIGMAKAATPEALEQAFQEAQQFEGEVFAERCIEGAEYTVAILGDRALPAIRLETDHEFYDYDAKYLSNSTRYLCPCGLSSEQEAELQALALQAFAALGCRGWGRVDFMADEQGFYLLEVNTVPGMTDHSLVPMAAKAAGLGFDQLVERILENGFDVHHQ